MSTFGQRYGYESVRDAIQLESMDEPLRNSLWNILHIGFWDRWPRYTRMKDEPGAERVAHAIWLDFFKEPLDRVPSDWGDSVAVIREFFFSAHWYRVYSFVEFMASRQTDEAAEAFRLVANKVMEQEVAGYRFVDSKITPITSGEEISEIETAISSSSEAPSVAVHLRDALAKLSDRDSPDYRNSIKESISAVEALANRLAGMTTSLGPALNAVGADTHPALTDAFKKLYGWTSDSGGIRHSLMGEPNLQFEDAKFMLVSCSAFVNYLTAKAARAGLPG